MSDFKKVKLHLDETGLYTVLVQMETHIPYYQELTDMYNKLSLDEPLQKEDLNLLIANPKDFIAKRLIKDEAVSIGNIALDFEQVFNIIQKPTGTIELIDKIITDGNIWEYQKAQRNVANFHIENGDTVVLNKAFIATSTENCTVYIENENQDKAYKILKTIAENINELNKLKHNKHIEDLLDDKFFKIDNLVVSVNPYFKNKIIS